MSTVTSIDGLTLTPLREIRDGRGAVLHMLRADSPDFQVFGECYFSEANPGAVKAWKRHRRQTQNLAVPVGRMRFVIYDARESSPTYGALAMIELGRPDAYARLRIPPMLWYGFACIGDMPSLVVNCVDMLHDPAESDAMQPEALDAVGALALLRAGGSSH